MAVSEPGSFAWHDGMLLGHTPMDAVHKDFVVLVDALRWASDAELAAALEALALHTREHFDAEEGWMTESDFPARECHAAEHDAVMKSVIGVQARVAKGDFSAARRLGIALADWFPGHADYLDAALAHWICRQRHGGGKPVVVRRHLAATAFATGA